MTYLPARAIHPGQSVNRALDHLGMSQKGLAIRTGLSEKTISHIINGEASLTVETAVKFENVLGGSAAFWLNLDSMYRTANIRHEQLARAKSEIDLAKCFPYNELVKRSIVAKTRDPIERVRNLWRFFGVDSLNMVKGIEVAAYRRGYVEDNDEKRGALAAWLRCGEIAFTQEVAPKIAEFNPNTLKELFPYIRTSTKMTSHDFFADMQNKLAQTGVGLVAVQYFPGTKASGAMRWIGQNPVIQLSTFGKDADKVWFTLFHELGHIILHKKKEQYISFTDTSKVPEELEADEFAKDHLISKSDYKTFISDIRCKLEHSIVSFAQHQGIDPGIVVGRMKKDGVLEYPEHRRLHRKLEMRD